MDVVESKDYEQNFNNWLPFDNKYGIKCVNDNLKYPKSLVTDALDWFYDWTKIYHIDTSFYKYIKVKRMYGVVWQVDFCTDEDSNDGIISLCEIYFNTKTRKIMQAVFQI